MLCFELEFLGFSSACYLDYYWSFRGSPAFYSEIVVLGTSTKLSLQDNPSRIISDWFEGSVLLQHSRPLQVKYLTITSTSLVTRRGVQKVTMLLFTSLRGRFRVVYHTK